MHVMHRESLGYLQESGWYRENSRPFVNVEGAFFILQELKVIKETRKGKRRLR